MDRTIRRVVNRDEQDAENFRYWQSRPDYERMQAVRELIEFTYELKGKPLHAGRSDRSAAPVQRIWR